MPKFLDIHNMPGATKEAVAQAHQKDLAAQEKHGAKFTDYWVDESQGKVFCLSEAPTMEAAMATHADAGHPADEIYEVKAGQ